MSSRVSTFGGVAGETMRQLLVPATLLTLGATLIATVVVWGAIGWLFDLLGLPGAIKLYLESLVTAPVVAQCALGAREGNLDAGLLTPLGEGAEARWAFVGRYAAFMAAWILPWHTLMRWCFMRTASQVGAALQLGTGKAALYLTLSVIFAVIGLLVIPLGTIVVTRAGTIAEVFSPKAWQWLLGERRVDLITYLASLTGVFVLFCGIAVPALLVVTTIAFFLSIDAGLFFSSLTYLVPAALMPILLGRMAGAFVAAEEVFGDLPAPEKDRSGEGVVITKIEGSSGAHATVPLRSPARLDSAAILKMTAEISAKANLQLVEALDEAEKLGKANPEHPVVLALLARLYLRVGRTNDGHRAANQAITFALRIGTPPVAIDVLADLADRSVVHLAADTWVTLGRVLLARDRLEDALWAFSQAKSALGAQPAANSQIEKGIIAVAEAASRNNKASEAIAIYEQFLTEHPSSTYRPYCESELARLRSLPK